MRRRLPRLLMTLLASALASAPPGLVLGGEPAAPQVTVLAINDVYRIDGVDGGMSRRLPASPSNRDSPPDHPALRNIRLV